MLITWSSLLASEPVAPKFAISSVDRLVVRNGEWVTLPFVQVTLVFPANTVWQVEIAEVIGGEVSVWRPITSEDYTSRELGGGEEFGSVTWVLDPREENRGRLFFRAGPPRPITPPPPIILGK